MKTKFIIVLGLLFLTGKISVGQTVYQWKTATSNGFTYKYVTNDPSKSRFYTLKNGLTVILSPNDKEPNVEYRMTVRAGSNTDPRNATGLAHYLEHLMFKGTDKYGTTNWEKEKPLLDKIDALYEKYNKTTDPELRKEIYKEIDKTSGEASNYSIANEYDKMMTGMGGRSTNAHTWYEETVYNEDFPSNSMDKFLALQAERFRKPIFRIFHTELEAVYEEKNRSLDNDGNKLDEAMMVKLFPTHNYGQQTTIGTIENLKNPSLVEIKKYYNQFYVPNNMALILTGDFNPDQVIAKVAKAFSFMVQKPVKLYNPVAEQNLTKVEKVEVMGPSADMVAIYYRGFASGSLESTKLDLIKSILFNGKAGLIDINLNKQQKLLGGRASYRQMKDYGVFSLMAQPKAGQTLEQASELLLSQIDEIKKGNFDENIIKAIAANQKLSFLQAFDSNNSRAEFLSNEFVLNRGTNWAMSLGEIDLQAKITKAQIVAFANSFFKDNYVIGFKRKGVDNNSVKVEKPAITPINANAGLTSPFVKSILDAPVKPIAPKFLDYNKDINFGKVGIADVLAVKNTDNAIFRMTYRVNMGANNYKLLPYVTAYLNYLGTDKYTAEQLSQQFYDIACSYSINVGTEVTTVNISGLQENFDKAVKLVEHIIANAKANDVALENLKSTILKVRENNKLNKGQIMNGLMSYAQYGAVNPFNNVLSNEEVKNLKSADLLNLLHNLTNYEHVVTYYGPKDVASISAELKGLHPLPTEFTPAAPAKVYAYAPTLANQVYFANYDMVQSEIRWFRNAGLYDPALSAKVDLFNSYFGGGMGSIVFQTIRESKALAYSTFAVFSEPDRADKQYSMIAYVGSQADKMNDAVAGMNELLTTLPENQKTFLGSKANVINGIETGRITRDGIFSAYFADKKLGFNHDSRADEYASLKTLNFADISQFHASNVAHKPYVYCIVASDKRVKNEDLQKFGSVSTLTLEQIFGY